MIGGVKMAPGSSPHRMQVKIDTVPHRWSGLWGVVGIAGALFVAGGVAAVLLLWRWSAGPVAAEEPGSLEGVPVELHALVRGISLPRAPRAEALQKSLHAVVTPEDIHLGTERVASTAEYADRLRRIDGLFTSLVAERKAYREKYPDAPAHCLRLTVWADASVPAQSVKSAAHTAAFAGYDISFGVRIPDGIGRVPAPLRFPGPPRPAGDDASLVPPYKVVVIVEGGEAKLRRVTKAGVVEGPTVTTIDGLADALRRTIPDLPNGGADPTRPSAWGDRAGPRAILWIAGSERTQTMVQVLGQLYVGQEQRVPTTFFAGAPPAEEKLLVAAYPPPPPSFGGASDPHEARAAALQEAKEFGMLGLLNSSAAGDPDAPPAPWGEAASPGRQPTGPCP